MAAVDLGPLKLRWDDNKFRHEILIPGDHPLVYDMHFAQYEGRHMEHDVMLGAFYYKGYKGVTLQFMGYAQTEGIKEALFQRVCGFLGKPQVENPERWVRALWRP